MNPRKYEDVKRRQMEFLVNVQGSLEIKGRSWEARMTQNGKKESQVGS